MIGEALMDVFRHLNLSVDSRFVVLEVVSAGELVWAKIQVKPPPEALMNEMSVQGGNKTTRHSPVKDGDKDVVCY